MPASRCCRRRARNSISIVDIGTDPGSPKVIANLDLMNSVFGPPTNLAITPDEKLALATNAMNAVREGDAWKPAPDNKVHVIDLEATPPAPIATLEVGQQPSGMAISPAGDLALVANRAGKSISVLAIDGKQVEHVGDVDMGGQVAAVAISPDGKRALAVKFPEHKVALLAIDGQTVTYDGQDIPVGLWPYNVAITPDGALALTADNGAMGASDGHVDTVSVIDLAAEPPRVIDKVVVGDAPEGLAISPTGQIAAAVLLNGSAGVPKDAWFANPAGKVVVLTIDGKKVTRAGEVDVGGLPEGVVFSKDGKPPLRRQLHRRRRLGPEGGRQHGHQHRAELAAARASRIDARQPSVSPSGAGEVQSPCDQRLTWLVGIQRAPVA